jgi:hypothetical protein
MNIRNDARPPQAGEFFSIGFLVMSEATRLIVEGYLRLKDRTALESMREHRQRLRKQLQEAPKSWIDTTRPVQLFDEELNIIEAAINRL